MNEINSLADEKIKKVSLCKFSLNWKGACFSYSWLFCSIDI